MKLSREEVLHIAALAKVGVTDSDVEKIREQLSNILENFEAPAKTGYPGYYTYGTISSAAERYHARRSKSVFASRGRPGKCAPKRR